MQLEIERNMIELQKIQQRQNVLAAEANLKVTED